MPLQLPEAFSFLWATTADDGLPVRYRAAHGGRGSAKSHSFARTLLAKGAMGRPLRIGCYREIQRSIRDSVKRLLDDRIAGEPEFRDFYESTDNEIRGANGTLFMFAGLKTNPDAVKSTEGLDIGVVFEANRVSQRSWDLLIPTVREDGSEIWAEWNPEDPTDPVDNMFRGKDGPPPGSIVREVNYTDNPFFPAVLHNDMAYDERRDHDKHAWVWKGQYRKNSEKRVFHNWQVKDYDTPANAVFRFGADWGFAVDPSVLVRMWIGRWEGEGDAAVPVADVNGRCLFIDYEAYKVGCEIDEHPALFAGDCPSGWTKDDRPLWENTHKHPGIPGAATHEITADSSRPETISYMRRKRLKVQRAIKGPGSVEDGVEFLKTYDIYIHTRCIHTAIEFATYSWEIDKLTREVLPELADKDNHVIDACRYGCEGVRKAHKKPAPPPAEKPKRGYVSTTAARGDDAWKSF